MNWLRCWRKIELLRISSALLRTVELETQSSRCCENALVENNSVLAAECMEHMQWKVGVGQFLKGCLHSSEGRQRGSSSIPAPPVEVFLGNTLNPTLPPMSATLRCDYVYACVSK